MTLSLNKAKLVLACALVFGHLMIIATVSIVWMMQGFFTEQYLSVLGIVSPIFAAYVSIILAHYSADRFLHKKPVSNSIFPLVAGASAASLGVIIIVVGAILSGVVGRLPFDDFMKVVMGVEMLFGIYLGAVVPSYFYQK